MANKTWTATDLELGKLTITRQGDTLHVERRYQFVDGDGDVLAQIAGGRIIADVAISALPTGVASALAAIDTWTKNQALEQEEMND